MTGDEAGELVLADLRPRVGHLYEPVVTLVEDAGDSWRVFYNSRAYVFDGDHTEALAGNWPMLVNKATAVLTLDEDYRNEALGLKQQ